MTPRNRTIIDAAVNLLSYALTGDKGTGLIFDITWDDDCATVHIVTGETCDHPNTGHRRRTVLPPSASASPAPPPNPFAADAVGKR